METPVRLAGMIREVLMFLVLLWFVSIPLFWQLDVSHAPNGNYGVYDTFDMLPLSILHILVFYALMFVSFCVRKHSLANVLMLALYHPIVILANYPYLTFRDIYLHAAPVRTILAGGNLQGYSVRDPLPAFWPSSFVLHGLSAAVLGCDVITTSYLLYLFLVVALALVVYCLARKLENKGYTLAWVCPILFLALFQNHANVFNAYARSHLAVILVLFLFFALIRFENQGGTVTQLLICGSLVTTHPFQSLYVSMFLFAPFVLKMLNRSPRVFGRSNIALFSAVSFLAWWLFHSQLDLQLIAEVLRNFWTVEYFERITTAPLVLEPMPVWGSILRGFYKYSLLLLLLIGPSAYMIRLVKREELCDEPSTIVTLLSVSAASGLFAFVLLALPGWGLYRASTDFLAYPAAFSSIIYLSHTIKKKRAAINKRALRLIIMMFVMTLSVATMMLRFEINQYYSELEHPSELSSLFFLISHVQSSPTNSIAMSFQTAVWAEYFAYDSSHELLRYIDPSNPRVYENQTALISSLTKTIDRSDFAVRGVRDILLAPGNLQISLELGARLHEETVSPRFNQIYSNWYFSLCSRRSC